MTRNRWLTIVVAVFCTALIHAPASADDSENVVRFGVGWYATIGDADDVSDNGLAAWGSYERLFAESLGVEVMIAYVDYDSILDLLGGISLTPITATLNYHLDTGGKAEFYVGPTVGFARLEFDGSGGLFGLGGTRSSETEFAWGAAAGVDVPFGEGNWAFAGSLRYLTAGFDDGDFDNIVVHVGFGRRF